MSGADPGFPVGGGANPLGGAPTYDFVLNPPLHVDSLIYCDDLNGNRKLLLKSDLNVLSIRIYCLLIITNNHGACIQLPQNNTTQLYLV